MYAGRCCGPVMQACFGHHEAVLKDFKDQLCSMAVQKLMLQCTSMSFQNISRRRPFSAAVGGQALQTQVWRLQSHDGRFGIKRVNSKAFGDNLGVMDAQILQQQVLRHLAQVILAARHAMAALCGQPTQTEFWRGNAKLTCNERRPTSQCIPWPRGVRMYKNWYDNHTLCCMMQSHSLLTRGHSFHKEAPTHQIPYVHHE
mmetsp:Transcript_24939/g.83190  ORF Transcript_24939/g.83190 Transcript_24939/m.83190 type:complete len:200 (+) Transcript_24939:289-888(+)